jgi:hypothetical protein
MLGLWVLDENGFGLEKVLTQAKICVIGLEFRTQSTLFELHIHNPSPMKEA